MWNSFNADSPPFIEPECSLPTSQQPSIQYTPTHRSSVRFPSIIFSHLHVCLPRVLLPSGFPTQTLHAFLIFPYVPYTSPVWPSSEVSLQAFLVSALALNSGRFTTKQRASRYPSDKMMDEPKCLAVSKTEIPSPSEIQQVLKRMDWTCSKNGSGKDS